jgi:Tol biopolymer transport system component
MVGGLRQGVRSAGRTPAFGALTALATAACLTVAPAGATIAFEKNPMKAPSIWVAEDSGAGQRQIVAPRVGLQPLISPDGSAVLFSSLLAKGNPALDLVPTAGGPIVTLAANANISQTAWSPDSKTIAVSVGEPPAAEHLLLIDVATKTTRTIATGSFQGVSFSPDSTMLAYGRAANDRTFPLRSDIYTIAVAGGAAKRITANQRSTQPVWGPSAIAFARYSSVRRKGQREPKVNVWTMNLDGTGARQLTHVRAPFLLLGPTPLAWSASGAQLLAEFGGQDTVYGQGVNPRTGAVHVFSRNIKLATQLVATGISRDGSSVLAATGGFDPGGRHDIVSVPYAGGPPKVLVRGGFLPSWND